MTKSMSPLTRKRRPIFYSAFGDRASNTDLEILEVVESDIQGPFPIVAFDG
jgi:hypothetical protein